MNTFNFKKKYGQNFLIDKNVVNKIVDTIDLKTNNLVIEIGPGDGKLTSKLCEKFDQVLCYEIDKELKNNLEENLNNYSNYSIIYGDFLKQNIIEDLKKYKYDNLYIIANLPYYITTPIIEKIIESNIDVEMMRFMVQKEVGDRISAVPNTKEYNSLTIYLNYNYTIKKDFIVSRNCFIPKPNVDSLIVSFYKKNKSFLKDKELFYKLVKDSFRYKRKTLKNNLKEYDFNKIEKILVKNSFDDTVRAEQLSIDIFIEIANYLSK